MATNKTCPRCGSKIEGYPALSRRDNKTGICSGCGTEEAIIDMARITMPAEVQRELKFLTALVRNK